MTAKRKAPKTHSNRGKHSKRSRYARLSAAQRSHLLLQDLRDGKGPYSLLLRKYGLDTRTAHKYLGDKLESDPASKRIHASKENKGVRLFWFPTRLGDVQFPISSPRAATTLAYFFNDRKKLLGKKMTPSEFEAKWRDVQVDGRKLYSDTSQIFIMAHSGFLKIDDLYGGTTPER